MVWYGTVEFNVPYSTEYRSIRRRGPWAVMYICASHVCLSICRVDIWPFDLESGVRVTCDVGYLCANFSLPRPLCSRLRPKRPRKTKIGTEVAHVTRDFGHHFQGQKVKGQLAGGGGILWRPPAQLDSIRHRWLQQLNQISTTRILDSSFEVI